MGSDHCSFLVLLVWGNVWTGIIQDMKGGLRIAPLGAAAHHLQLRLGPAIVFRKPIICRIGLSGLPDLSKSPMTLRLDISPECGDDCCVLFPELVGGRAAEIGMGAGQPVAESKVADASRPEPQDVTDDIKDSAIFRIELEQRHHGPAVPHQDDDGIIADHGLYDAFGVFGFDTQEHAGV